MKKCTDQDVHNNAYLLYYILDRFCYNLKGIVVSSKHRNTWWKLVSYTYVQNKMEAHGTYKIFQEVLSFLSLCLVASDFSLVKLFLNYIILNY